jgi:2-phospho-L-lactate guanylyltransferase (CobY/MobA/RfbA family)
MSGHHAVIPVKGLRQGKSRLATLDSQSRYWLNRVQFMQTVKAVKGAYGAQFTTVTSTCAEVRELALAEGVHFQLEAQPLGLNGALVACRARLAAGGAASMTVVPVDLLQISCEALTDLLKRAGDAPFIVPDREMKGTNVMRFPLTAGFDLQYGEESFCAHLRSLLCGGVFPHVYATSPLNDDLDLPVQLAGLASWLESVFAANENSVCAALPLSAWSA